MKNKQNKEFKNKFFLKGPEARSGRGGSYKYFEHVFPELLLFLLVLPHPTQHQVAELWEVNQAVPGNNIQY